MHLDGIFYSGPVGSERVCTSSTIPVANRICVTFIRRPNVWCRVMVMTAGSIAPVAVPALLTVQAGGQVSF